MELKIPKGTRDFLPEDKIIRDKVIGILKKNFELFGYNPLETPALEMLDTLASKYAGGEEILKEIYTLNDNADRELGLRYDLTVPFARVIAMNPELKKPFKRYQIDRVWRNGPIKLGRYREFWQCDVDVVGIKSVAAEAEYMKLISLVFNELSMPVNIDVNSRKLLDAIMESAGVAQDQQATVILSLDKLEKIGVGGVTQELSDKGIDESVITKVLNFTALKASTNQELLTNLEQFIGSNDGINEMKLLLEYVDAFDVQINLKLSLARGLSYYTGCVWEVFMKDGPITSSLAAGGRYDNMIGEFLNANEIVPAVGMSFGLDVISDALKSTRSESAPKSVAQVYVIPLNTLAQSIPLVSKIRESGIATDVDLNGKGIKKSMNFADKMGIPYVCIIGENEIQKGSVSFKNMKTGESQDLSIEEVIQMVKNNE